MAKVSDSIEYLGEINATHNIDELDELLKKSTDSEITKAKKITKAKAKLNKEIENRAIRLANKRGIDESLARLQVLEQDPQLYRQYKKITQKAQGLTAQQLYN